MLLKGSTSEKKKLRLIKSPTIKSFPKGVLVVLMIVDLSKETILVRVVNITDTLRFIKKGEVLAMCAAVTNVKRNSHKITNQPSKNLKNGFA